MDDLSGQEIRGYKLIERIGEGGFGVVYRAEQPAVDREVSIKVILPEFADHPEFVQRFEAEARMVAKLEHPHIVPLYDYWRDEEGAFLVMRWLRGGNLREALESGPMEVEAVGQLLEQIADALNLAHKQGVIHRDLKPENILLDEDGHAYLTDFGIAKDIAGERLTQTGKIVGSVDYLAPEQAKGEEVTPRTDIYGLGVVLYEMLTGEHPFPGLTPIQRLQKHLNEPLPSIRVFNPEFPDALDYVIQRATAKDPTERYSNVSEIVEAYKHALPLAEDIGAESQLPAFLEEVEEDLEVQRPVFVGRARELAQLDDFLEKALAGQGQVVFVTGGAGRGKTALVDEFCRRSQEINTDLIVTMGSCNAHTGVRDPYLPFRDVFGMLTGDVERLWTASAITREHAKRLWDLLPLILPALLNHGSSLIDILVPGNELLSRARAAYPRYDESLSQLEGLLGHKKTGIGELEQSHLFEQCTNVLRDLAEHNPLTLVLDDLQWADNASIDLLFHLGRRLEGSRILIIGAYRPEVVALGRDDERHPLESVVNELKGKLGDITIDLGIEEEAEGKEFVSSYLDSEPNQFGQDFRQALYEHTGGHPLFTIELLRAMGERGEIIQDEEGRWVEGSSLAWDALPARVEAVIAERIGRLEEELREALSVASVEGEDFTVQVISRVQDIQERRLLRELSQELERRHRLVREQEELKVNGLLLSRYRFVHQLLQRYLYNNLSAGERRLLHGEIASVLEDLFEDYSDQIAVQLAFHYGQAGNAEKELHYQIQAGNQVLDSYAHKEAETYYRRALELVESDTDRAEILSGLGEAMFGQSRFTEAIETWREGITIYQTLGSEGFNGLARLYARSARAAPAAGDWPEGLKLCQEGLEAVANAPESYEIALLVHEAGRAYQFNGFPDEAEPLCRKALEMAERIGSVEVQADTLATYGTHPNQPPEKALEALTKAVEIAETAGLLDIAQRAHNNLAHIKETLFADFRGALSHYLRSVELANRIGAAKMELFHLSNALYMYHLLGDYSAIEEALPYYERLRTISYPLEAEWKISGPRAFLLFKRGQWMEALQERRDSIQIAHQEGDLQVLMNVSIGLADRLVILYRLGEPVDLNEAEEALMKAIEISDRGLASRVIPRCLLSIVHARKGAIDDAHRTLIEAKEVAGSNPIVLNQVFVKFTEAEISYVERRWSESLIAFEEVAGIYDRLEMLPRWAMTLMLWADVHIARGESDDLERAEALLQDAKSAYKEMGAPYFVGIIEKKLEYLQAEADK